MTEQRSEVEPPFCRRSMQLTIAASIAVGMVWVQASSWGDASSTQAELEYLTSYRLEEESDTEGPHTPLLQIDLNSASRHELSLLPGVGPVLASRIVADRGRNGCFQSVDALRRVHGIGPVTLRRLRPMTVARKETDDFHIFRGAATDPDQAKD